VNVIIAVIYTSFWIFLRDSQFLKFPHANTKRKVDVRLMSGVTVKYLRRDGPQCPVTLYKS